ncbi:MAG TPA: general stress protein [Sphingomonadaceae bacterium]|nr:general stress protein [Sphingomonadaceae bacterium]
MSRHVTSAVFDTQAQAEAAVSQLRHAGISDRDISIIAQHGERTEVQDGRGDTISDGDGHGVAKGATMGAGVGALAGVAALLIPGVGPFIAAGALVPALGLAGASVATGALAGAATGGLVGALTDYGVSESDSHYYEERVRRGGVIVTVDLTSAGMSESAVSDVLYAGGGHNSTRAAGSMDTAGSATRTTTTNVTY